eukprot:CAMPEP_0175133018 /NCGR_PEP_ID=MMETSP0087-20121206/7402_1 /TAXON_ID=136419 /ORGANISM="Unknown Unknown, Strain D1" /LENGTH=399 /DNA_ID=CAMNT_0016415447 /DNA_START=25 /DNA_END=1224 /DNA_ORIENTATION=+
MSSKGRRPPRQLKKPEKVFEKPHWVLPPPPEFAKAHLEVYKEEGVILKRIYLGKKSCNLFGRDQRMCDEVLNHPSISRFHVVFMHCAKIEAGGIPSKPTKNSFGEDVEDQGIVVADLHSSHFSLLNGKRLPKGVAVLVFDNDVLVFGGSTRFYKVKGIGMTRQQRKLETQRETQKEKEREAMEALAAQQAHQEALASRVAAREASSNAHEKKDSGTGKKRPREDRDRDRDKDRQRDRDRDRDRDRGRGRDRGRDRADERDNKKSDKNEKDEAEPVKKKRKAPSGHEQGFVRAKHILVKHKDVRNPKSWLEPEGVTRTKEEAVELVQGYLQQIKSLKVGFSDLAKTVSHCSSAKRGGDLGKFGPKKMQKPFEDAAFALDVNEISEPVFTMSGVHIIKRTQ